MAVFKCKMCGGTIEFEKGATVGVCDSCGTKQTLPRLDDDRRANLYDRANHFRRNNDFDKAMGIYEQILAEDNSDAEAYWSLVLCRYGIEYVEDPTTHKRVPTVNRAQYTSIFADEDYKSALKYADSYQRLLYEEEAKAIDEIQKGILEISNKEDPFDVFICYKETDASGRRTQDSVLANDLYHQLTQEGFKVFFARITLEDKLGTAYEPYIFAALNSAKVMVVLGTKPEYFNAVWVKNEWSRYLGLVKKSGGKKVLIPAYRDMDPYDLPDEFSHLQAQDMSKLGFMQDLIRGIKKIAAQEAPRTTTTVKETVVVNAANANVEPLLKRAFMFLEDGDWKSANEYCEKVLDTDPENAKAYLGKLMAELKVRKQEDLKNCPQDFSDKKNYQKAIRFADEELKKEFESPIAYINERKETERKADIYNCACETMGNAAGAENCVEKYEDAAKRFKSISGFKDADAKAKECKKLAEEKRKIEDKMSDAIIVALQDPESIGNQLPHLEDERGHLEDERNRLVGLLGYFADVKKDYDSTFSQMQALENGISELKAESAKLGLFAGKRKKEINTKIEEMQTKLTSKQAELAEIEAEFQGFSSKQAVKVRLNEVNKDIKDIKEEIKEKKALCEGAIIYSSEDAIKQMRKSRSLRDAVYAKNPEVFRRAIQKGFIVKFGAYMQSSNDTAKTPIEWLVLTKEDNKILVISKYALDCQKYNTHYSNTYRPDVAWEACSLRKWLNNEFINAAFTADEQAKIQEATVTADKNLSYSTDQGNDTTDKIFLLSINEVNQYLIFDRMCASTAYAKAQGACTSKRDEIDGEATCWWWLRSRGEHYNSAANVYANGSVNYGSRADLSDICVRPAMWINLDP